MFLRVKLDQKANNSLLDQWGQRYTSSFNSIIIRSLIINIIPFPVNVYVTAGLDTGYSRTDRKEGRVWNYWSEGKRQCTTSHHLDEIGSNF